MTIVSSQDFVANHNRYFDLAIDEQVIVKRGDYSFRIVRHFENERPQKILKPDDKLRNAITAEELIRRIHADKRRQFPA